LTESLLDAVFKDAAGNNKLDEAIDGASSARARLKHPVTSGYLSGADLVARFAVLPPAEMAGQYWVRSGIAGFAPDAAQHFYLPERYTDPFGNVTKLAYDPCDLFIASRTDPMGNVTRVTKTDSGKYNFDYRVLAPREMQDINNNLSEVFFDVRGLPTAMAVKGKGDEGDNLLGFDNTPANLSRTQPGLAALRAFFDAADLDEAQARTWLGNATARHIYYFGEIEETLPSGTTVTRWAQYPPCACGIVREQHVSQLAPGAKSPIQAAFEYSDGMGSVIVKKIQAEPEAAGQPLRWVASGKTILNNKGKPVKQYEPYFSSPAVGHRLEEPVEVGVTAVIYYDSVGRTVRTEMPDGSYSRVQFSAWHVLTFDQNDTVKESKWYTGRNPPDPDQPLPRNPITGELLVTPDQRAAWLAAQHAGTPALIILDSLGREVISVAHNRIKNAAGVLKDEKYLTFTKLDAEGKPLWIRDARNNLVMQYITPSVASSQASDPVRYAPCYDIAGNLLFQHSMDGGDRWMLNDATGKPMVAWDSRRHAFRTDYDPLHRPTGSFVKGTDPLDADRIIQFEQIVYGDTAGNGLTNTPENDQTRKLNLRGKPYRHHDTAGLVTIRGRNPTTDTDEAFDFKGNLLRSTRQLLSDYKTTPDWSQNPALEAETFTSSARFDALNRPIQFLAPHSDQPGATINVTRPAYNAANLLERVDVWLEQAAEPADLLNSATASLNAVTNIDYDAKGQRTRIEYNEASHPVITDYTYDPETYRLVRLLSTRPKHPEADKCTLQDLAYHYDPVGNVTAIRDAAQQTVNFDNSTVEPSNAYVYDALYRLIRAEGREHAAQNSIQRDARSFESIIGIPFPNSPEALQRYSEDYDYDPVGNIMGLHHAGGALLRWNRRYQYATDSNRLLATRLPGDHDKLPDYTVAPGYAAMYGYDVHGNMTSMPHLPMMEWDFKDQLRASQQQVNNIGTGEKTWYVYDAGGQRVRKVTELPAQDGQPPRKKDERIYLGSFELYRKYNGNGQTVTLERESLHVMDDKQRVALIETRTRLEGADPAPRRLVRLQLGNHLGSAALELDDKAQVISYEEFHPYGSTAYEAACSQTEAPKRYRYTGKERDEETGFSYHGARYYAPWLGRWVSCDPAGLDDGVNLYQSFVGNPICLVDDDGCKTTIPIEGAKGPLSEAAIVNLAAQQGWKVSGFVGYDSDNVPIFEHGERISAKQAEMNEIRSLIASTFKNDSVGSEQERPALEGPRQADPSIYRIEFDGKSELVGEAWWKNVFSTIPYLPPSLEVYAQGDPDNDAEGAREADRRALTARQEFESRQDVKLIQSVIDAALAQFEGTAHAASVTDPLTGQQGQPSAPNSGAQLPLFSQTQLQPLPRGVEPYQLFLFPVQKYDSARRGEMYGSQSWGLPKGYEFDHQPSVARHWYEGQGGGYLSGYNITRAERRAWAGSWYSGRIEAAKPQRIQGGQTRVWTRQINLRWGLIPAPRRTK
jgi:RHS repeat-associated protein